MVIKYIFFDIDNTLFPTREFAELARKNAIRAMIEMGLPIDSIRLYEQLLLIIKKHGSNDSRHFNLLLEELKIKQPARYIAAAVAAYHNAKASILPYPDVPRTLLSLRESGYALYVATNGTAIKQWDKLIRLGIHHYFKEVFVSEEVGMEKNPAFFKRITQQLSILPGESIMIGDTEKSDILPAKEIGMKTLYIQRYEGKIRKGTITDFSHLLDILKKI